MSTLQQVDQLYRQADYDAAKKLCLELIQENDESHETYHLLGIIEFQLNNTDNAHEYISKAISLFQHSDYFNSLGIIQKKQAKLAAAEESFKRSLSLNNNNNFSRYNLAELYCNSNRFDFAEQIYKSFLLEKPDDAETQYHLGVLYSRLFQIDDAEEYLLKSVTAKPYSVHALNALVDLYIKIGEIAKAQECCDDIIALDKNNAEALRKSLVCLLLTETDGIKLRAAHEQVALLISQKCKQQYTNWPNNNGSGIRLGFLSPDFKQHSVGYFLLPLLSSLNNNEYQIFLYSLSSGVDHFSELYQSHSDCWKDVSANASEQIAKEIYADGIDILFDITGHFNANRLEVFCYKPAPSIISWLGYPATTGLTAIDFKISSEYCDPLPEHQQHYVESLLHIPDSFLCYQPVTQTPDVEALPYLENGYITFGVFNTTAKYTEDILHCWAKILASVPHSRLFIKSKEMVHPQGVNRIKQKLESAGIEVERVRFAAWAADHVDALAAYKNVDISLDTFPYNGTTTTFESLWMGVPVVTLAGQHHGSRVSGNILNELKLTDWIAGSFSDYVAIAIKQAAEPEGLANIRAALRDKLQSSSLMDTQSFSKKMQTVIKNICQKVSS